LKPSNCSVLFEFTVFAALRSRDPDTLLDHGSPNVFVKGHTSYYTNVWGPDILHWVIVSGGNQQIFRKKFFFSLLTKCLRGPDENALILSFNARHASKIETDFYTKVIWSKRWGREDIANIWDTITYS